MLRKKSLIKLVTISEIVDDCYLYFIQNPDHVHFRIKRVYFITRADVRLTRGSHAHKKTEQVVFCIQGSIKLILDNGRIREEIILDRPNVGVYLKNMLWHEMLDFKKNTILLILASKIFDEQDYIRNYEKFKKKADKIS